MKKFVVTVDGTAASGKSTLAKKIAEHFGFLHIDAGMMFRAVALFLLRSNIDIDNFNISILDEVEIKFNEGRYYLGLEDVTEKLNGEELTRYLPLVGFLPNVRDKIYTIERKFAQDKQVVFNGRDVGAVVLPQADIKFFITASPEERARRRLKDYEKKGYKFTFDEVLQSIGLRDREDIENRNLIKPDDAIEIDNTYKTLDEVLLHVYEEVKKVYFKSL